MGHKKQNEVCILSFVFSKGRGKKKMIQIKYLEKGANNEIGNYTQKMTKEEIKSLAGDIENYILSKGIICKVIIE